MITCINNFLAKIILLYAILLINSFSLFSQIYSFHPISYYDIETNPAYIATDLHQFHSTLEYLGKPLPKNDISSAKLTVTKYFKHSFWGIGGFISNTSFDNEFNYQYGGIAIAYRNVIFDKVFIKTGAAFKLINHSLTLGYYDNYHFESLTSGLIRNEVTQNMNLSISFSSPKDYYYLSFGIINYDPSTSQSEVLVYPRYYFLCIGDILKLLPDMLRNQLSFSIFKRDYGSGPEQSFGYNVKLSHQVAINRMGDIHIGSELGKMDDNYFQIIPFAKFNRNYRYNRFWSVKIALNLYYTNTFYKLNEPMSQISLIYNL